MVTRRERVILELQDDFSTPMARAAASAALLDRNLNALDGSSVKAGRSLSGEATRGVRSVGDASDRSGNQIDRLSGRLAILARTAAVLGPTAGPIGASAVPALAGLTTQLGFAVAAAGTAVLAFQGVGDALETVREYELDPTTENLEKAGEALKLLSPSAREFVLALRDMAPQLAKVRDAAAGGLFPGLTESLDDVERLLPTVQRIVRTVGDATGDLLAGGAAELASSEWEGFFAYLEDEARPTLTIFGQTVGNITKGLAELMMALDPASDDFGAGLLRLSERFESWAEGLSGSQGFEEFLAYVRETGPQVLDTLGSLAGALLDIAVAAAPLGGPVLRVLEALAEVVSFIASSPLGPPIMAAVTAMSALNLATLAWSKVTKKAWVQAATGAQGYVAAMATARRAALIGAAGIAAVGVAASESATGFDATNTAMGIFAGSFAGPPGIAIGAGIGLLLDLAGAGGEVTDSLHRMDDAIASGNLDILERELEGLKALRDDLTSTDGAGDFLGDTLTAIALGAGGQKMSEITSEIGRGERALNRLQGGTISLSDTFSAVFGPAVADTRKQFDLAAMSADDFRDAVERLNRVLEGRAALRDYEAALDDFRKTLNENGAIFDITREKGREVVSALDDIAGAGIRFAETLKGQKRIDFLKGIREDLRGVAERTPAARREVKKLVDEINNLLGVSKPKIEPEADTSPARKKLQELERQMLKVDKTRPKPKVDADTSPARDRLAAIERDLFGIPDARTTVYADTGPAQMSIRNLRAQLSAIPDEMVYIRSQRLAAVRRATGGAVKGPGTETSDSIPVLMSNDEHVWSAREVRNAGGHLAMERMRAMARARALPAFRDGGSLVTTARPMPSPSSTQRVKVSGTATATLRTPWGDQQIEMRLREIAREESAADRRFEDVNRRRPR